MSDTKYCNRYMDDAPGIRGDCNEHRDAGRPCVTCQHRNIRAEVLDLRAEIAELRRWREGCVLVPRGMIVEARRLLRFVVEHSNARQVLSESFLLDVLDWTNSTESIAAAPEPQERPAAIAEQGEGEK